MFHQGIQTPRSLSKKPDYAWVFVKRLSVSPYLVNDIFHQKLYGRNFSASIMLGMLVTGVLTCSGEIKSSFKIGR